MIFSDMKSLRMDLSVLCTPPHPFSLLPPSFSQQGFIEVVLSHWTYK